ncbi:MAG: CRTAC1 family protein [Phycisphaerae bacterium]|nr:CRTAC1 family protein [Phycisphaerae bacterium]
MLSSLLVPLTVAAMGAVAPPDGIRFTDITKDSGLDVTMTSGGTPSTQILEVKGGGLALIDYDNDGDFDLFVPNGATLADTERGPGARLFRNDSTPGAIRFVDVTAASGIAHTRWSFGSAVGDIDGDGFDDLVIACYGPNVVLRNKGDGTFEDISAASGIRGNAETRKWSTAAALADIDADGDLDLYLVNYLEFDAASNPPRANFRGLQVIPGPKGFTGQADRLYRNDGKGVFTDITESSGIGKAPPSYGLNVAVLDLSGDGKPDIFVGNDSQKNFLFINRSADGTIAFDEVGLRAGIATNMEGLEQATMGIGIADVDGNGRADVFTTNFSSDTNTLHLNLDGKFFDDRTAQFNLAAVSRPLVGWAPGFFDFDHDGDEDLLVVNGHVYPQASKQSMDSEYEQRPLLMERRGKRFEPLASAGAWTLEPRRDRTALFADLDRDGDVDILIGELNGRVRVIRNDHALADAPQKDWIVVVPRDVRPGVGNRHAVGSLLTVRTTGADGKELTQRRWLWGGGPFMSNLAPEFHVGIPAGTTAIAVELTWPDGTKASREKVAPGERLVIERAAK